MQTYGANYTLMGMSLTCIFGRREKWPTKKGQVYFGRFYQAKRQRVPASRIGEAGTLWGVMHVWRHRIYYGAAAAAFPQIKPAKINLSLNDKF